MGGDGFFMNAWTNEMAEETEASVARDADPECRVCGGNGWHWGWDATDVITGKRKLINRIGALPPVMLRCPCVDRRRAVTETGDG